jgi:hypothetical protein
MAGIDKRKIGVKESNDLCVTIDCHMTSFTLLAERLEHTLAFVKPSYAEMPERTILYEQLKAKAKSAIAKQANDTVSKLLISLQRQHGLLFHPPYLHNMQRNYAMTFEEWQGLLTDRDLKKLKPLMQTGLDLAAIWELHTSGRWQTSDARANVYPVDSVVTEVTIITEAGRKEKTVERSFRVGEDGMLMPIQQA